MASFKQINSVIKEVVYLEKELRCEPFKEHSDKICFTLRGEDYSLDKPKRCYIESTLLPLHVSPQYIVSLTTDSIKKIKKHFDVDDKWVGDLTALEVRYHPNSDECIICIGGWMIPFDGQWLKQKEFHTKLMDMLD